LDIDGVLNSERFNRALEDQHRQLGHHEVCECFKLNRQVDREAVTRLNRLVAETCSKIVISSSWRKLFDPPELHRILSDHGLVADIIGETPDGQNAQDEDAMLDVYAPLDRIVRGHEIDFWLRKHPEVERFVILDDGGDMEMHKSRLVQTDAEEGLLDEHIELAIRVMAWHGHPPSPIDHLMGVVDQLPGSSWGVHCKHDGCVESLALTRRTRVASSHDDDYQHLMPALYDAAVSLGWRCYDAVYWCPGHVVAKKLACARCLMPCPGCSCVGGPRFDATDGVDRGDLA
jgi:hypothetical protein